MRLTALKTRMRRSDVNLFYAFNNLPIQLTFGQNLALFSKQLPQVAFTKRRKNLFRLVRSTENHCVFILMFYTCILDV